MAYYPVKVWEDSEQVTYRIEANSPEEAQEIAVQVHDERWRERNTRKSLEEERVDIQEELDRDPYNLKAVHYGIAEGFSELGHGIADSALNIADSITSGLAKIKGPTFAGMGIAGRKMDAKVQQLRDNNAESAMRFSQRMHENVVGRELTPAEQAKVAEETAQFVKRGKFATDLSLGVAGGTAALAAKTAKGLIAVGAAEGGLGAYLFADTHGLSEAEALDKRMGEAKWGAVLGTGLSLLPSGMVGAKNWLGNKINKAGGGPERISRIREGLARLGIWRASPGQVTGNPDLLLAEQMAANQGAQQMFNEQAEAAIQGLARQAGVELPSLNNLLRGSRASIREGVEFAGETFGRMRGQRNSAFSRGLDALEDEVGGLPVIPVETFVREANEIIRGIGTDFGTSTPIGRVMSDIVADINKANAAGGLTPKQANSIFLRLNGMRNTGTGLFDASDDYIKQNAQTYEGFTRKTAKALRDGLLEDMAQVEGRAGVRLGQLRDEYGAASTRIANLEDAWKTSVGLDGTAGEILDKLAKADPDSARTFVNTVRNLDGGQEMIDDLITYSFQEAVRRGSHARAGAGARLGDFDLEVFLKNLQSSSFSSRIQGLLTEPQEAALQESIRYVREILNHPSAASKQGVIKTHFAAGLENLAINALSRDPGFMARLVGATIQKGKGAENLFFTKQGQDLLFNARNTVLHARGAGAATQGANATIAYMTSMLGAGEIDRLVEEYLASDENLGQ